MDVYIFTLMQIQLLITKIITLAVYIFNEKQIQLLITKIITLDMYIFAQKHIKLLTSKIITTNWQRATYRGYLPVLHHQKHILSI